MATLQQVGRVGVELAICTTIVVDTRGVVEEVCKYMFKEIISIELTDIRGCYSTSKIS
jgi:hypothetical protein